MSHEKVEVKWKKLHGEAKIPCFQSEGAACFDIAAAFDEDEILVKKGQVTAVPTGLSVEVPQGYELQLRARSGLAFKHGLSLVNGVGTIDSDYRGEIKVLCTLLADEEISIKKGDRIAQALIARLTLVKHVEVLELSDTERGAGGFGSTGIETRQDNV